MFTGPNIVRDGLVFGYDTGYPIVSGNSDTYRFNLGEPTTNLITSNGLDFTQMSTYGNLGRTQVVDSNSPTGYACEMEVLDGATINPSARIRFGDNTNMPSTGNAMVSVYVKFEGGPTSNIVPRIYNGAGTAWYSLSPLDGGSPYLTSEYRRFGTYQPITDNPGFSMTQNNSNIQTGQITRWHSPQVTLKAHATPFTTGTRSATQSLVDITGNRSIDLSNVSFNSNGQMAFDGTDDYIDLGSDITFKTTGGWTVESVVKYNSVAGGYNNLTSPANFIGAGSASYNSWFWSVLNNKLALWNISPGVWKYGSTTLQADNWYHVILVSYDSGTSYQMYLNGVAEGGDHTTYSWNASYSGLKVRYIGAGQSTRRYTNGELPVNKIYNRALTAQEVQQNYRAYKNRFDF